MRILLAVLLLLAVPAGLGRAQEQPGEGARRAGARELVKSGDASYRLFKFKQALADYEEAYRLTGHPAILFNIAQAYRQLKNFEKAHFSYKLFLSDWAKKYPDRPPPFEAEVRGHIARLGRLIEEQARRREREAAQSRPALPALPRPKPEPRAARLELEGLRQGAEVYVDGRYRKVGPQLALGPGSHQVRVELDGYHSWSRALRLEAGQLHTERVELRVADHRTPWLVASLSLSAAAAGLLGVGAYYNARHNDFIPETREADDSRRLSVIFYVAAGGAAAVAAASWTLYLLHRRKVLRLLEADRVAGLGLVPLPGGTLASGTLRF